MTKYCAWHYSSTATPVLPSRMLHLPQKLSLQHHQTMRLPRKVTLQHDQILRLPRKVTPQQFLRSQATKNFGHKRPKIAVTSDPPPIQLPRSSSWLVTSNSSSCSCRPALTHPTPTDRTRKRVEGLQLVLSGKHQLWKGAFFSQRWPKSVGSESTIHGWRVWPSLYDHWWCTYVSLMMYICIFDDTST